MYRVSVIRHFDSAHFLRGYEGKCESLHGHRYQVKVTIEAAALNDIGLAFDFTTLKKELGDIILRYDHHCLNDLPPFDNVNPSAENIAETIYRELRLKLEKERLDISQVEVWESPDSSATYIPETQP
jgi:6-pyruvoyltetrahydropterin/6-carboxytetrahydropterin synthase